MPAPDEQAISDTEADWLAFSGLDRMKSHWDRPGWWPGRRAYYWYLTFSSESRLHDIAIHCQAVLDAPYFNLVPPDDLHMTIDRIAFDDEISEAELEGITAAAAKACRAVPPFAIQIGPLAGSPGAISFSASPRAAIMELRNTLDNATGSVLGTGRTSDSPQFRPHIGIAYCNRDVAASPIVKKVRELRNMAVVDVAVCSVSLVTLTREPTAYQWIELHNIPLGETR